MPRPDTKNGTGSHERIDTDPGVREGFAEVAESLGLAAPEDGSPFVSELVEALLKQASGGGGEPPPKVARTMKRHNWAIAIVVGILAPSGIVASYYATKALAENNATQIEKHVDVHDAHREMIDANAKATSEIKQSVDSLGQKIDAEAKSQRELVESVDALKRENVERLNDELRDLRRENRRLRRR